MKAKFSTTKSAEQVVTEVMQLGRNGLGINLVKSTKDKAQVICIDKGFYGYPMTLTEVTITVRKVNNTMTSVVVEKDERSPRLQFDYCMQMAVQKAYQAFTSLANEVCING